MGVSPATGALLAIAADPNVVGEGERLRTALRGVADWERLSDSATKHGVLGLLYRSVARRCADEVPAPALSSWRERATSMGARSLSMQRELLRLMERFEDAGLEVLAFKGPVLAEQLYGDANVRDYDDLDVMVRMADVEEACRVARASGYVDCARRDVEVPESVLHLHEQEIELVHPVTGLRLEIHWRSGPRFAEHSLRAEDLFERAETIELLGRRIPCLGSLDAILGLAVHAVKHDWDRLEDACAMNAALGALGVGEDAELVALAASRGLRRRLVLGVLVATGIAGTSAPTALQAVANGDIGAARLARRVERRLMRSIEDVEAGAPTGMPSQLTKLLREAWLLDTVPATLRYAWRRIATPTPADWGGSGEATDGLLGVSIAQAKRVRRLWHRHRR